MSIEANPLVFEEATHTYRRGKVLLPSVSSIIKPLGTGLESIPQDTLDRASARGREVHYATELDDRGMLGHCPDDIQGYLDAWRLFRAENPHTVMLNEKPLANAFYAGRPDRILKFRLGPYAGLTAVVDIKSVAEVHPYYRIQVAGYRQLADTAGYSTDVGLIVNLRKGGSYKVHQCCNPDDLRTFNALLTVAQWRIKHGAH